MKKTNYEENHEISYFQIDNRGKLSLSALILLLQEVALNHSRELGYDVATLYHQNRGWIILNWHVEVKSMPYLRQNMKIETWNDKCRRMQANRSYYVTKDDIEVMRASSRWVFMDLENRRPVNMFPDMVENYKCQRESIIEGENFVVSKPVNGEESLISTHNFFVTRRDTDTNGHTNNVKYIEWAMDYVPDEIYEDLELLDLKVVYRKESKRGEKIVLKTYLEDEEGKRQVFSLILKENNEILAQIVSVWK